MVSEAEQRFCNPSDVIKSCKIGSWKQLLRETLKCITNHLIQKNFNASTVSLNLKIKEAKKNEMRKNTHKINEGMEILRVL